MGRNLSVTISNSDLCSSHIFWSFCPLPPFSKSCVRYWADPSNNSRNQSKTLLLFTELICTGLTCKSPRHSAVSLPNSLWPSPFITTKSALQHNLAFFEITSVVKVSSVGSDFELPYACKVLADLGVPALMFSFFQPPPCLLIHHVARRAEID